jgi:transposase-like protein
MSETFSKVEVITGVARRRRFPTEQKVAVVAETMQPGMSISYVARRHRLSPSLVFRWRRLMSEGGKEAIHALDLARANLAVTLAGTGRFPVKTVADTLDVARSNVVERQKRARPARDNRSGPAMSN